MINSLKFVLLASHDFIYCEGSNALINGSARNGWPLALIVAAEYL
jgi:hypothetical protein